MKENGLAKLKSSDLFNSKTYWGTIYGINIYLSDKIPAGEVVKGEVSKQDDTGLMVKVHGRVQLVGVLSKEVHLVTNPKSSNSLLKNIVAGMKKEVKDYGEKKTNDKKSLK